MGLAALWVGGGGKPPGLVVIKSFPVAIAKAFKIQATIQECELKELSKSHPRQFKGNSKVIRPRSELRDNSSKQF